VIFHLTDYH